MKVFISQPMKGKSGKEITKQRKQIKKLLTAKLKESIDIIDQRAKCIPFDILFSPESLALFKLGQSVSCMAEADLVVMAKGWQNARGCRLEYEVAKAYKKPILVL